MTYVLALCLAAAHAADRSPGAARDETDRRAAASGEEAGGKGSGKEVGEKMTWGDMEGYNLSFGLPSRLTEQEESGPRVKVAKSWQPDGEVIDGDGIALAAEGGEVAVKLRAKRTFSPGESLAVYRLSLAKDADEDQKARYVQRIGWATVSGRCTNSRCRVKVVRSSGAVLDGDWLKREKL